MRDAQRRRQGNHRRVKLACPQPSSLTRALACEKGMEGKYQAAINKMERASLGTL